MICPAPPSPSSFLSGVPSENTTPQVLCVALAYFLPRLRAFRKASTASRLPAGPPLTAYRDPRSEMMPSNCFIFQVQFHVHQHLLEREGLAQEATRLVGGDHAIFDGLVIFAHQHGETLTEGDHVGVESAVLRGVAAPLVEGQGDAAELCECRGDMGIARDLLEGRDRVDRHEAIGMFVMVGIVSSQRGL